MPSALLVARDIVVEREGRRLVDRASLELEAASVISIAGPSGCGKSTLLRAIATLIPMTSGEVLFEGRRVDELGVIAYRRRVAYVPQSPQMFEGTVADNVRTGPRFRGVTLTGDEVLMLLSRVGLDPSLAERAASDASGGERLRIALARALANEPSVLLLDEPTASLDPDAARVVLDLLVKLASAGTALLVVTHIEEHAAHLGGEIHPMKAGVLSR